jgi:hypothetical protein
MSTRSCVALTKEVSGAGNSEAPTETPPPSVAA